ncbi:hypothetical protein CCM_05332 [Cordyceps militaris CM01]|uniref:Uncharacterized protein n=2 Tax=Cordyceps militaris TaxID=73501 RepID=G3JJ27_CORMM|nr:uncharacterized protein CCM_05332 [Cordyceps militaris CM01]ATY59365.1 hypothetical protein A9K55_002697 [Cordyceps militaris]EGX91174.1 hypothetical protein CCM_05332 [Cordyceps militaris CM01]
MPALPPRGAAASQPTVTLPLPASPPAASPLGPRAPQQSTTTPGFQAIPSTYREQDSSLAPGAVAGIVLGSVGAFLLLLALLYSCTGWTPVFLPWSPTTASTTTRRRTVIVEDEPPHRHKHRRHKHRRRRSSRSRTTETEMFEVHRTASRARAPVGGRTVHIPAPPPPMMPSVRVSQSTTRHGPPRVVRDDATETDLTEDEIVVMEEHSPPRHQSSGRRSHDSRRDSRRYSRGP